MFDPEKWAVWDYRATIVNDGVNSGNHTYLFTAGAGNICILLGGRVLNGDAAGRTVVVHLRNADLARIREILVLATVAAGKVRNFPTTEDTSDGGSASSPPPVVVAGTENLFVQVASLAVNENTEVDVQFLVSSGPLVVDLTSPTDAVETETENRIQ